MSGRLDGTSTSAAPVPVCWGGHGTDTQHSFFHALHQGTQGVPAEFIGVVRGDDPYHDNHTALLANLLAQTEAAQELGMENRTDLGGYDAMVFAFASDVTLEFTNHFVPVDLSIGWFNSNGRLVDDTVMNACPSGDGCPSYASRDPYRFAIETLSGGLGVLGVHDGSVVHLGGSCT